MAWRCVESCRDMPSHIVSIGDICDVAADEPYFKTDDEVQIPARLPRCRIQHDTRHSRSIRTTP